MGLSAHPAIWQSYINAILRSIPDRSKYLAIMDDLLLHSSKQGHLKYLEDLLKAFLQSCLKIFPKKCQLLELNYNTLGTPFLLKKKESV